MRGAMGRTGGKICRVATGIARQKLPRWEIAARNHMILHEFD
jgi:hypothetical protein